MDPMGYLSHGTKTCESGLDQVRKDLPGKDTKIDRYEPNRESSANMANIKQGLKNLEKKHEQPWKTSWNHPLSKYENMATIESKSHESSHCTLPES